MAAPSTTDVVISLDPGMVSYLDGLQANTTAGQEVDVYVYAFFFVTEPTSNPAQNVTVLVGDPYPIYKANAGTSTGVYTQASVPVSLTDTYTYNGTNYGFTGGQVYIVTQQVAKGTAPSIATITAPTDIINAAATSNYSYQLFEMALANSQYDQGDISSVNTFGMTSSMTVTYWDDVSGDNPVASAETASRGFNSSAQDIFDSLPSGAVSQFTNGTGADALATGPGQGNTAAWSYEDWVGRLRDLADNPAELAKIQIVDFFNGTAASATWPQQLPSQNTYSLQYVPHDQFGTDYFWLIPDTTYGVLGTNPMASGTVEGANTNWIRMSLTDLAKNIYIQPDNLEVHVGGKTGGSPYFAQSGNKQVPINGYPAQFGFTPNDANGDVAKYLVAGFDAGLWGTTGSTPAGGGVDLNKSYNWNANFTYGGVAANGVTTTDNLTGGAMTVYDSWGKIFTHESNAYGYSYTDLLSAGSTNPLVSLWGGKAGVQAAKVEIAIYAPGDVGDGYIGPSPIIRPSDEVPDGAQTAANWVQFNFQTGSQISQGGTEINYGLGANVPATLIIHSPSGDHEVTLPDGQGYYYISNIDGVWTAHNYTAPAPGASLFAFHGLPVAPLAPAPDVMQSFYGFSLVIGSGANETTYNFYTHQDPHNPDNIFIVAADHGVTIGPQSNVGAWSLNAAGTYSPELFEPQLAPGKTGADTGVTINGTSKGDWVNVYNTVAGQAGPTAMADKINGGGGTDRLSGLGGNDIITGGGGRDFLYGNGGDDIIVAAARVDVNDWFDGGEGVDTLMLSGQKVSLAGFDSYASSIEKIGAGLADTSSGATLSGTGKDEYFNLGALVSIENLSLLDAGGGDDWIVCASMGDTAHGGLDIAGGKGSDVIVCGAGQDRILVSKGGGLDVVVDFGSHDVINISGISRISSFADLKFVQSGSNVLLILDNGTSIGFENRVVADFTADNFTFENLSGGPGPHVLFFG